MTFPSSSSAAIAFAASLVVALIASSRLSRQLERLSGRLGLAAGVLGLITALGADSPEIASAATALSRGSQDLGNGIVIGSNMFNIAALFGFGALIGGRYRIARAAIILNGIVATAIAIAVGALLLGHFNRVAAGAVIGVTFVVYIVILCLKQHWWEGAPLPEAVRRFFVAAVSSSAGDEPKAAPFSLVSALVLMSMVAIVVAASLVLVASAQYLAATWQIPHLIVGTLIIAPLTGLPNLVAGVRLAMNGRGNALISETLNSNSVNFVVGAFIPSLFVSGAHAGAPAAASLYWLGAIMALALGLALLRTGLGRLSGALLLLFYGAYAVTIIKMSGVL